MIKSQLLCYAFLIMSFLCFSCAKKSMDLPSNEIQTQITTDEEIQIKITSVKEWGGTPPDSGFVKHELKSITIHHGGEDLNKERDISGYLRSLQSWSRTDKNWIDVPYHFIIDLDGNIYEGRNSFIPGDTNTEYNPVGHLLTCLLGNYENIVPTEKQIGSLTSLLAWQSGKYDIPLTTIAAHKDYAETACPGKNLYPLIQNGTILSKAKSKLGRVTSK